MTSPHFNDEELRCHCGCGLNNASAVLLAGLELLRTLAGKPVSVDSVCRCETHNKAVGGVPGSEHTKGLAADVRIYGLKTQDMYALAVKVPSFAAGGIGVAVRQGYIHVDVRSHRARWCYNEHGASCAWNPQLGDA